MTKEQERISNLNKKKAWDYFVAQGVIPADAGRWEYVLHHIDPLWKHNDIERYIQWNIEDLVVMRSGEHTSLHWKLDYESRCNKLKGHYVSAETRAKLSKPRSYHWTLSDATKQKMSKSKMGHSVSDEAKKRMSESATGKSKSDLHRQHISEAAKKVDHSNNHTTKGKHWSLIDGKRVYSC